MKSSTSPARPPSTLVIDLTQDESDEDEESRPGRFGARSSLPSDFPVTHDGLKTPGAFIFSGGVGNQSMNGVKSRIQPYPNVRYPRPLPAGTRPFQPNSLQSPTNSPSQHTASANQPHMPQSHRTQPFHPVKRRKIHGGPTQYAPRPRIPSLNHSDATQPRAHVSAAGKQGSNIRHADDRWSGDPRMHKAIEEQVLKHVRTTVNQYHDLAMNIRDKIGRRAAKQLVAEPGFVADFEANGLRFSNQYEMRLANKARDLVDRFAGDHLMVGSPVKATINSGLGKYSQNTHITVSGSSSTRSPSEDIEVQRRYSSSPTTSFSNDHGEDDDLKNVLNNVLNITGPDKSQTKVISTFTSITDTSKATSIQCRKAFGTPRPQKYLIVHPKPPTQRPPIQKSLSLHSELKAIHTAQSLRISGLDVTLDRPYLSRETRGDIRRGFEHSKLTFADRTLLETAVLHVDFCSEEIVALLDHVTAILGSRKFTDSDPACRLTALMLGRQAYIPLICDAIMSARSSLTVGWKLLRRRTTKDIHAFLEDATAGQISNMPQFTRTTPKPQITTRPSLSALLREREISGFASFRVGQGKPSFRVELSNHLEDSLIPETEWTDCSGDITTISWTSSIAFICGATAHSDKHNMQYNKPGNLGIGSSSLGTLQSVANHRIPRPLIDSNENAENALESMRQTQDSWLYTSVVSTAHSEISGLTFTASFDHSVKVWDVMKDGLTMDLRGTWEHDGKVNFVVTSTNSKRVATASDVSWNAVRVYEIDESKISSSPYDCYTSDREQTEEGRRRDGWAYFPATIAWGISPSVVNLLLVGYSPRSVTAHESDIPEEKRHTGEVALWNVEDGTRVPITSSSTQNVFEVLWHPTQPTFFAATSPSKSFERDDIKTQVRLFAQNETGVFGVIKTLDCRASDINELTVMPNSRIEMYVTASCTDGSTYVWDTAQGDDPIHVLGHGESLDNPIHDLPREDADTGVKFAAWGQTSNRFYTGSSDGKVKAWDVTAPKGQAFVRTILSVSGGVSAGAFSPDYSRLLVGDATGKVHLLSVDDLMENPKTIPKVCLNPLLGRRVPNVIIPHRETQQKTSEEEEGQTAREICHAFLERDQIRLHFDRRIGAHQGSNYSETNLYCAEAHEDQDPSKPLLPDWQVLQQYEVRRPLEGLSLPRLSESNRSSLEECHLSNQELDLELSDAEWENLRREGGVDGMFKPNDEFDLELLPRSKLFQPDNGSKLAYEE